MARDPRYDIPFEPVRIGPVTDQTTARRRDIGYLKRLSECWKKPVSTWCSAFPAATWDVCTTRCTITSLRFARCWSAISSWPT